MQFGGGPVFVIGADTSRAQRDGSGLWLQRVEAPEDVAVSELPFAPHDLGSHACAEPAPADWLARAVVSLTARLELLDTRFGVAAGLRASVEDAIAKSMPSLLRGPPHAMMECMRFLHEADAAAGAQSPTVDPLAPPRHDFPRARLQWLPPRSTCRCASSWRWRCAACRTRSGR